MAAYATRDYLSWLGYAGPVYATRDFPPPAGMRWAVHTSAALSLQRVQALRAVCLKLGDKAAVVTNVAV